MNDEFLLTNVYAPNQDDPQFFSTLFQQISDIEADQYIIGGDLNKILDPQLDKKRRSFKT